MVPTKRLRTVASGLSLDWFTTTQALRLSIPPFILISLIESDTWIEHFTGDCYLGALVAAFSIPFYPGAKFVQFNIRLSFGFAISFAYSLLAGYSSVRARGFYDSSSADGYNSSAEAVVGVYLLFFFWLVFTLRSMYPARSYEFVVPGLYGATVLPTLGRHPHMPAIWRTANTTIQIFLVGQAVGFVNGVLMFPRSCRKICLNSVQQALLTLQQTMREYQECMNELRSDSGCKTDRLRTKLREFSEHVQRARSNLRDAQNEFAWGRLDPSQMKQLVVLLEGVVAPLTGLATIADMLELVSLGVMPAEVNTSGTLDAAYDETAVDDDYDREWLLELMYQRILELSDAMAAGTEHGLSLLGDKSSVDRLIPDSEAQKLLACIGKPDFMKNFSRAFDNSQKLTNGEMTVDMLLERFMEDQPRLCRTMTMDQSSEMLRYFIFSHVHALLSFTGAELGALLIFIQESQLRPNRVIFPQAIDPYQWLKVILSSSEKKQKSATSSARDPDHLPPQNFYESVGSYIIKLSELLCSEHSVFGVKGACAVMTISIIALLRPTQDFYSRYRFEWALFAILLSMSRTTGASTFSFCLRLFGTACSMIASYVIWYAPNQNNIGVIVLLWVWLFIVSCLWIKHPRFFSAWLVMVCAAIIMIGNELSVRKLNPESLEELNQALFPSYILFPFRLAVVFLGIITAYFYTVFPGARSEHAELRRKIASTIYALANYQAMIRQIVIKHLEGSPESSTSDHSRQLVKVNSEARAIINLLDWEVTLGGRFPKENYVALLPIIERVKGYLTLQGYASKVEVVRTDAAVLWAKANESELSGHLCPPGVTGRLIILHSALLNGHPLPPELPELRVPNLEHLLRSDGSMKKSFAIYALIHNLTWYTLRDVNLLTELVRDLVGSLTFSNSSFDV